MKRFAVTLSLVLGFLTAGAELACADDIGSFDVGLRYRYELVDDEAPALTAKGRASTLRTTLGYRTPRWRWFEAKLRFEDVTDLGLEDNHANAGAGSLSNGVTGRPVIADPELTEILEVAAIYRPSENVDITAGRSEINLAEQRYLGAVGWRQHHQSFDMARVDLRSIPRTKLTLGHLARVHRIFGDDKPMQSEFFQADVDGGSAGDFRFFGYLLDYERAADAGASTETLGVQWKRTFDPCCDTRFTALLEYAMQEDGADNPLEIDADYYRVEASAKKGRYTVKLGQENLGARAGRGRFQTPLATLHKWNGWADKFLSTPPDGLVDSFATFATKCGPFKTVLTYHDFTSDLGSTDYGTELDVLTQWTSPWTQVFALKAAFYNADEFASDTTKIWFWTSYRFGADLKTK